ncbi:MAG TPA: peroxiredoxin [Thermoplasmata archaeon]|nr:peroxiredoxin [Thermoplasmata archaeon]
MVAVGDKAPEFEAVDHSGSKFQLASTRGAPLILYFYPRADTPGCTIEAKGFRDVYPEYRAKHVQIVGVSTDDCPAQQAFRDKYGLPFPLLADHDQKVSKLYGVLSPKGAARRVSFYIDPAGTVTEIVDGSPDLQLDRARAAFLTK